MNVTAENIAEFAIKILFAKNAEWKLPVLLSDVREWGISNSELRFRIFGFCVVCLPA